MPWISNNMSYRPTMYHTATIRPTRSGPGIPYNTPLILWHGKIESYYSRSKRWTISPISRMNKFYYTCTSICKKKPKTEIYLRVLTDMSLFTTTHLVAWIAFIYQYSPFHHNFQSHSLLGTLLKLYLSVLLMENGSWGAAHYSLFVINLTSYIVW